MLNQEWICMKCSNTSHVKGDQFFNSQHAWACWPNELTICSDINEFQIPVKTSCTGQRRCKREASLFSVQGKSA